MEASEFCQAINVEHAEVDPEVETLERDRPVDVLILVGDDGRVRPRVREADLKGVLDLLLFKKHMNDYLSDSFMARAAETALNKAIADASRSRP